jgi:hypothetical protein
MTSAIRIHWSKSQGSRVPRNLGQDVDSYFASLGQEGSEESQNISRLLLDEPCLQQTISAMPSPVSVPNKRTQVARTNRQGNESLGQKLEFVLG